MNEKSRILVGIDGSESSRIALRWALAEAAGRGAILEVLHAWRMPMVFVPDAYDAGLVAMDRMDEASLRFIERELDAIGADGEGPVAIERTQSRHFTARALIEASERADLVVLGRHGAGGFPHELMTPKVVQVAHHAACSVAVVPDAWRGHGRGVVVGVDGSPDSLVALRWAVDEARRRNASVTAVMAWGLLDQHHADAQVAFTPGSDASDARAALASAVAHALGDARALPDQRAINDLPAQALLGTAGDAELLVVGSRGLGGFDDLRLGSVSHRCLAHSPCPTVAVR